MLNICNICLRTNITVKISEDSYRNFHNELCDFEVDGYARYCSKCLYLLRKFYDFRNKCLKANMLLKLWEKYNKVPKQNKQDINRLHEKLPTSLGLSNDSTHTIFSYSSQTENIKDGTENNIEHSLTSNTNVHNDDLIVKPGFVIIDSTWPIYDRDVCTIFITKTEILSEEKVDLEAAIDKINIDGVTQSKLTNNETVKRVSKSDINKSDIKKSKELHKINESVDKTIEFDSSNNLNMNLSKVDKKIEIKKSEKRELPEDFKVTVTIKSDEDSDTLLDVGSAKIEQHNFDGDYDELNDDDDMNDRGLKVNHYIDNEDIKKDDEQKMDVKTEVTRTRGKKYDDVIEEALRFDSSDNELLEKRRRKMISTKRKSNTKNKEEVSKKRKIKDIESNLKLIKDETKEKKPCKKLSIKRNLEEIKRDVKRRLGNGDVKDKHGNVIDADAILNNLDSMSEYMCSKIKYYCAGNDPFTPEAINFLGKIKKRYTKAEQYSNVFITKQLTTDNEIMEEFKKKELSKEYLQCEHKCTLCFRHFKYGKMLKHHLKQYHDTNKLHKCRYCNVRFDRPLTLYRHIQTHKVVYQCMMCPLATNHKSVMKSHCDYHKGVKYPCTKCDAVFKSHPVLSAHMNRAHQPDHICPCCAKMFYTANGLSQHRVKKHQNDSNAVGPPSAKCEQCNIQFISDEVHQQHQSNSHKRLIPRIVKVGKKRKTSTLNRRKPRFTCRMCKAVESSIGGLMWHFKSEHPNEQVEIRDMALRAPHQYLCHECGKDFKDITNFTDHKNIHTGVRPYACTECPKSFYYRRHLNNHLPLHSPPTKLCPHCGKAFRSNSNLCNHLRQHTGNRRHACEICGKTFLHQSALTEHVRSVHLHIRRTRKPKQRVLD